MQQTGSPEAFDPVLLSAPPHQSPGVFTLSFAGASSDFSHVVFLADDALTGATADAPEAAVPAKPSEFNVYESVGGELRLVNVLPGNATSDPNASVAQSGAVSADGSRIYWTDQSTGRVYLREDGASTIEVPDAGGGFLTASSDGSRVLLTDGHVYGLEGGEFKQLVDLSEGNGGFQGIFGASADLSTVYFVDTAMLGAKQENSRHEQARAGVNKLYVHREGVTSFIANLVGGEGSTGEAVFDKGLLGTASDWAFSPSERSAQVTADGRFVAFMSRSALTGYANDSEFEVFEYDANSESLSCVSCGPKGEAPGGESHLSLVDKPLAGAPLPAPRSLSEGGQVFFDSFASLTPAATDGHVENVYEYEPDGVGSCESSFEEGGCISLISSGLDTADSQFVDATPSGSDVFFVTRSRLVLGDEDNLFDLYDARVGGGFGEAAGGVPPCTNTDSCRIPPAGQPAIFGAPSTETFTGAGNPSPAPPPPGKKITTKSVKCKKGFVKNKKREMRPQKEQEAGKASQPRAEDKIMKTSHALSRRLVLACLVSLVTLGIVVSTARADFGIVPGSFSLERAQRRWDVRYAGRVAPVRL